jgi:hypothetical protein
MTRWRRQGGGGINNLVMNILEHEEQVTARVTSAKQGMSDSFLSVSWGWNLTRDAPQAFPGDPTNAYRERSLTPVQVASSMTLGLNDRPHAEEQRAGVELSSPDASRRD